MKITVIGCGRWGSFIAWYLQRIGHDVTLYGRPSSDHMQEFQRTRTNGMVTLPREISLETDLAKAIANETIVVSINSQGLRSLMEEL